MGTVDIRTILRILPQRPPYLMLDRVLDLQPRKSARAIKAVSFNEPFFDATHHAPVMPPTLCLEAMFQLACVLAYASNAIDLNQQVFVFAGVELAKFRHPVTPGDLLTVAVQVSHHRSNVWQCDGITAVGETVCAEARLLTAIQDVQAG